jgi:hypothetical protein
MSQATNDEKNTPRQLHIRIKELEARIERLSNRNIKNLQENIRILRKESAKLKEAIDSRFVSANDVPVERIILTRELWEELKNET